MSTNVYNPSAPQPASSEEIGERLKRERQRLGMSQEKFGAGGGVQRVTQDLCEQGDRSPTLEDLVRVVSAGVDLGYLAFGGQGTRLVGRVCLDKQVLASVYRLVEEFSRDSKGRLLDVEHRLALFESLCSAVAGKSQASIDWRSLRRTLKRSVA